MATRSNPRKDFVQIAHAVFQQASGEAPAPEEPTKAQETGRKGGLKGGVARKAALTPEQRSEIARLAAQARWKKSD